MIFGKDYKKISDEELMSTSASGDTRAFTALYDRYSGKMYTYFKKMLWNDDEKSRDFCQDLFSKLIEKPEMYKEGKKFSSWLYSIAANMCKNEYRSAEVRSRAATELKHHAQTSFSGSNYSNYSEYGVDQKSFKRDLNNALELLSPEQKIAFIMKHKQGFKIKEIAEVLHCSEGTIKSRLFYALKILSSELVEYHPKPEL